AEDGIRDFHVTGVQTCALPISRDSGRDLTPQQRDLMRTIMGQAFGDRAGGWQQGGGSGGGFAGGGRSGGFPGEPSGRVTESADRSEERRVGKECISRWAPDVAT